MLIRKLFFALLVFQNFVFCMDGEFELLNPMAAKLRGSYYKGAAVTAAMLPPQAAHHVGLAGTDTDLLLKGIMARDTSDYCDFFKDSIVAAVNPWIDSLDVPRLANQRFLVTDVKIASLGKPDRSINSFKEALEVTIRAFNPAVAAPATANIRDLKATKLAITQAFVGEIKRWLGTLRPTLADPLLEHPINLPAINKPAGQSRGQFENSIEILIKSL